MRQGGQANAATGNVKAQEVAPDTPVITLHGVCGNAQAKEACTTVITREDMDRFVGEFAPESSEAARGHLAVQYARTIAFAALAEQQGVLQRSPALAKEIDAELKLFRMRLLANIFLQNVQKQTSSVTGPAIARYIDEHRDQYEQAQVRRLSVPAVVPTESGRPPDRGAVRSVMEEVRARAAAGEDLQQLQVEAYKRLHIQATPPPVIVVTLRKTEVQGEEAKIFDLKPGEVSGVLESPAASVVMKLESRGPMPLESVRPEIITALNRDGLQATVGKLTKQMSAEFNLEYLGLSSQPNIFVLSPAGPVASRSAGSRVAVPDGGSR